MKEIQDLLYASMLTLNKKIHDELLDHLMDHQTLYPAVELSKLLQLSMFFIHIKPGSERQHE
jgi:hypothetical protein